MRYLLLIFITGCSSSLNNQLSSVEHENAMLRDHIAALQEAQAREYIELINAEEALRKFERKTELDWPLPPCKAE
jgi:hypothetical protein